MPDLAADKPKRRILFVDDEPLILEGLQRMLRAYRKEWDMTFVDGGDEALKALQENPTDVIVTDMRMPGMDGAQLLEHVKQRFPSVIRIVLSGYFEKDAGLRAVPVAHQFVAKPCDPVKLREAIERCCSLSVYVNDDNTRRLLGSIGELPSLSRNCASLMRALEDPEIPVNEISRIVEHDVGITAKVLQLVNSAFFGPSQEITNVRMAVSYLGLDVLKTLVLSAELFRTFRPSCHAQGFSFEGFQEHSQLAARIVSHLPLPKSMASTAVVAALLHDTGILILSARLPQQFEQALSISLQEERPFYRVEAQLAGTTHAEVGAYLLGVWGLPNAIVDAVGRHHGPMVHSPVRPGLDILAAVYIADILSQEYPTHRGSVYPQAHDTLDTDYLAQLGLADEIPAWRAMAAELSGVPTVTEA
ncbi:MAG TPA: response regulator [Bryobacteraceae bacterium]|jgi:HD-like signal output (HDOD) protein|nr:response regulator [Bryobacteraceae bacterium]